MYVCTLNNITQKTAFNLKGENLENSYWGLIRTHHNYPLEIYILYIYRVFQVSCPDYKSKYLSPLIS